MVTVEDDEGCSENVCEVEEGDGEAVVSSASVEVKIGEGGLEEEEVAVTK